MPAYARLRTAKRHRGPGKKKVWGSRARARGIYVRRTLLSRACCEQELRAAIFSIGTIDRWLTARRWVYGARCVTPSLTRVRGRFFFFFFFSKLPKSRVAEHELSAIVFDVSCRYASSSHVHSHTHVIASPPFLFSQFHCRSFGDVSKISGIAPRAWRVVHFVNKGRAILPITSGIRVDDLAPKIVYTRVYMYNTSEMEGRIV